MDNALKLRVMFDMIDNFTKPLKNMLNGSKGMTSAIKESREQLAALNREQKKLDGFRDLKRGIKASSVEMQHAGDRARQLRLQLGALEEPARRKFENASQLKAARAEFDRTAKVMQTMNRLTGNKSGASVLAVEYRQLVAEQLKARQEIKRLEAEQKKLASQTPVNAHQLRALQQQYDAATRASDKLRQAHVEKLRSLRDARAGLTAAGISTRNLAEHEHTLRANIVQTTAAMQTQTRQLEIMAEREKKLGAARGKMQALQGVAGGMAIGGYAAKSAGAGVLGGLGGTLDEAKKAQNEIARIQALGLGEQSTRDAEKFARGMKVHGSSYTDNLTMMRDSMTIFADEHHAQMAAPILSQMKFANEAMYGAEHGEENERKFMNMLKVIELRNGTKDEATFRDEANRVQKVISATGGRVGGDQWMEFIQRGGVAAKSLSKDAFFYQMEPIVQEMQGGTAGNALMSGYQNLIEGRTTVRATRKLMKLGLLDAKKVEYDKNGHVKAFADGALLNAEQYKSSPYEWLQKTLLPALAKKGIKGDKAILSAIGSIFTNRSASNLFATMYLQRDQIAKNERLNKGAAGITELDDIAKQQTSGKEIAALAKLKDLKEEIGERVTPIYNAALDKTRELADRLLKTIKAHPEATKAIVVVAAALGGLLAVMGTFTIVLAGVLGPLAVVRFSMTTLGMKGGLLRTVFGGLASLLRGSVVRSFLLASRGARMLWRGLHVMSGFMRDAAVRGVLAVARAGLFLGRGLSILASLLRVGLVQGVAMAGRALAMLGRAIMVLGRLALANPLLAFIALLAIAAVYVWQNWDTLGPKFAALWETIKGAFGAAGAWIKSKWDATVEGVKSKLASIGDWFGDIGARFTEIGGHLIDGLVNGIKNGLGTVKETISSVADSTVTWFKEKLGIHSPSRVFATLGGFVSEGAAVGIESAQRRVANAALGLATAAVASFGAPVLAASAALAKPTAPLVQPTVPIDRRAPLAAATAASSAAAPASPIVINIYPQAGQDPHAIARAVEAALDRRERAKQSRIGSRLSD